MTKKELEIENRVLRKRLTLINELLENQYCNDDRLQAKIAGVCLFLSADEESLETYKRYPDMEPYVSVTENPDFAFIFHPEVQHDEA